MSARGGFLRWRWGALHLGLQEHDEKGKGTMNTMGRRKVLRKQKKESTAEVIEKKLCGKSDHYYQTPITPHQIVRIFQKTPNTLQNTMQLPDKVKIRCS
jgi:hypothetical protein